MTLLPHYCVDENLELDAKFFGVNQNFKIITLPKSRASYSVPSLHVKNPFVEKNYKVIDSSNGIITFERFCNLAGKKDKIIEAILDKFANEYPCINIHSLNIKPTTPLPFDFKSYKLLTISLKNNNFRKRKGSFRAIFKTPTSEKNIYFKFTIDANIKAFKAKHKLFNDKILSRNDYEKITIKIDKLPSKIITCKVPNNLMTKNYISANSILTMNKFEYKKDILRGTDIRAYIRDGMLVIATHATVLEDGNIGDILKVKTDNGKLLRAKLISKYKAIILE
ncbi:flagellar basal body P-ring formation chaperone FlgA [Sulfurospirillum arcachonense]|uniref:flagellar basal body P-ring formation chaperone FlgA n=1 Tax=Sulfurospirillum arcachonense TaxID=57666 RepID=UPI00046A30DF|nr:flagellar basal body P-ring formation chaperone FlgA [Sulfurospirillum arcachonense]